MKASCQNLRAYLMAQREHLRRAIEEHKWYLSERAGYDVGWEAAKNDFYRTHLDRVAQEFRVRYCRAYCVLKSDCSLVRDVESIPSLSHRERGFPSN